MAVIGLAGVTSLDVTTDFRVFSPSALLIYKHPVPLPVLQQSIFQ